MSAKETYPPHIVLVQKLALMSILWYKFDRCKPQNQGGLGK
jgi:hypothetical protein